MPLYDFYCERCNSNFESWAGMDEKETDCPICTQPSIRIISPVRFKCGGGIDPGFPTAWDRWAKDHERLAKQEPRE